MPTYFDFFPSKFLSLPNYISLSLYLSIAAEVSAQFAYKCISILLSISLFVIKIAIRKFKPTRLRRVEHIISMLQIKMRAEFLSQNVMG